MIGNCAGCEAEFDEATLQVEQGYYVATAKGREFSSKGHLMIMLVDDKGRVVVG